MNRPPKHRHAAAYCKAPAATCAAAHKMRFATEAEARNMAVARMKRDARSNDLAVYRCEHCGDWHHTSRLDGENSAVGHRRVWPRWTQDGLDRALALARDAVGVALTALFEHPKGDLPGVLPAVRAAAEEAKEQLEALGAEDLDSPELRAALDSLRPKLRAMELLARRIGKVDLPPGPRTTGGEPT